MTIRRGRRALIVVLAVTFLVPAAATASQPVIHLAPEAGPAGTSVDVEGDGFVGDCATDVFFDSLQGSHLASARVDDKGSFATRIVIPHDASPGTHDIVAVGRTPRDGACDGVSDNSRSADFDVTREEATPFDRTVHLVNRVLEDPGVDGELVMAIKAAQDPVHAIVQLDSLPRADHDDLGTLRQLGVEPLAYLNGVAGTGTAYLAAVAPDAQLESEEFRRLVRGLQPLLPQDKLDPVLTSADEGVSDEGASDVLVLFFPDVGGRAPAVLDRLGLEAERIGEHVWTMAADAKQIEALAAEDLVQFVAGEPDLVPGLDEARAVVNADRVQRLDLASGTYDGLTGSGVDIAIVDTGVDAGHDDLAGRVLRASPSGSHGTHVAAIAAGSGARSDGADDAGDSNRDENGDPATAPLQWRGVAPEADVIPYLFRRSESGSDPEAMRDSVVSFGADVSNHSYGLRSPLGYLMRDQSVDAIIRGDVAGLPPRLQVYAAMNNGASGYFSLGNGCKNCLLVGNIRKDLRVLGGSSSLGPTPDGRLKPEVVAVGTGVTSARAGTSSVPSNGYVALTGTSMAAPAVTGVAALMLQRYVEVSGVDLDLVAPLPSTLKAILVHTARDLSGLARDRDGRAATNADTGELLTYGRGPDWASGYGRVDAEQAVDVMGEPSRWAQDELDARDHTHVHPVEVAPGQTEVKVTLAWDDLPAAPNLNDAAATLVNDLDVVLVAPDGTEHRPLVLPRVLPRDCDSNPMNGFQVSYCNGDPADQDYLGPARPRVDRLNNLEQVVVRDTSGLEAGMWTARVSVLHRTHTPRPVLGLPLGGAQPYSIVGVAEGPDRFERNDTAAQATPLTLPHHSHLDARMLQPRSRLTSSSEHWSTAARQLTLFPNADVDEFRLPLPDPRAEHPDAGPAGLPECGFVFVEGAAPLSDGPLLDVVQFTGAMDVRVDAAYSLGEALSLRDVEASGDRLSKTVRCPRDVQTVDEVAFAYGERPAGDPRLRTSVYDLEAAYHIAVQRIPGEARWIVDRFRLGDTARIGPLLCQSRIFPDCLPSSDFGARAHFPMEHPQAHDEPCRPGCSMHHPFWWPGAADLDVVFRSDREYRFQLFSGAGEQLGEAEPIAGEPFPLTATSNPPGVAETRQQRLRVPALEAGFYVLVVNGAAGGYDAVFQPPPTPPDTDGDGLVDPFDDCPDLAEDPDGLRDGDGCPDIEVGIDVTPGDDDNVVNASSRGVVPVAILTTTSFDATTVDPQQVCLGTREAPFHGACTEAHGRGHPADSDADGNIDVVLHFDTEGIGLESGDRHACLVAKSSSGAEVHGCAPVRVR